MTDIQISSDGIAEQLKHLGIKRGDKIVMHSSLRTLGKASELVKLTNCGADAVIDGFMKVIGDDGILCVPTFTKTFVNSSAGPIGEIFHPDKTPSRVGSITNVLLQRHGRVRSLHPTHSWAALGNKSDELLRDHEKTSTFGRDSVCGRMYDWDFKIVWFGTTGTTNTSTHFAEDWLDMPYMSSEDALVETSDGSFKKVTVYRSPSGPRDFYKDGCKLDKLLEKWNIQAIGKVYNSTVVIMQHRTFMNYLLRALLDNPCLLLHDNKDDAYHERFYELCPKHVAQLKKQYGSIGNILKAIGCTLK